jgi:ketol-acid reductoisomerase
MAVKDYVTNKKIAILGYNIDGQEQAISLRDEGVSVIVGLREGDPYWPSAEKDGFTVYNLIQAVEKADIIQVWY